MTTRALEDSEIKAIFDHVSGCNATRNRAMLLSGIGMALRASELVGLRVGDVRGGNGNVKTYVTIRAETAKFNKERTIRIGNGIQEKIAEYTEWKKEHREPILAYSPLFKSQKGGHLTRQGLFDLIKRIFLRAGINQSCHALRKTGATLYYIESDYDLIATQQFLGHSDSSVTRRYIGLTTEQLSEYSERLSDHLITAIHGSKVEKLDTSGNMSSFSVKEAISFLNQKGFEVTLSQKDTQKERKKSAEIIKFPSLA